MLIHQFQIPTSFYLGPVNVHLIDADPLTLVDTGPKLAESLDALVAGPDHLRAPDDHSRVRVGRPRAESRGHCLLAKLSHDGVP